MNPTQPAALQKTAPLDDVRVQLTWLWMVGCAVPFFLLIGQSFMRVYEPKTQDVWSWFLPNILPSLTVMISTLVLTASDAATGAAVVRKSFVSITRALSIAYLFAISLTILLQPIAATADGQDRIALMKLSNLWLAPLQGLVSSAIGALFITKEKKDKKEG